MSALSDAIERAKNMSYYPEHFEKKMSEGPEFTAESRTKIIRAYERIAEYEQMIADELLWMCSQY